MIMVEEYRTIEDENRRLDVRIEARHAALAAYPGAGASTAARRYAELMAAEAGIRIEGHYPGAARVAFRVNEDETGPSVLIWEIHGREGEELYRDDDSAHPYYEDQSEPGDKLTAALIWDSGVFEEKDGTYTYAWR